MKEFFRGTTPLLRFHYPFKYARITKFSVTFYQDGKEKLKLHMGDKEIYQVEDGLVTVELTEKESKLFKHNFPVDAQLKILTNDGDVWAGDYEHYQVHRLLDTDLFTSEHDDDSDDESGEI